MDEIFCRTANLIGEPALQTLKHSTVAVFGVGGVGSYTVEALARSGVGNLVLVDKDVVSVSNVNRQLVALLSTVGQPKVAVAKSRIADINPEAKVETHEEFFNADTAKNYDFSGYDYVVDAIDTVTSKLLLAECCKASGTRLISAMGAGNKLEPTGFIVDDIKNTSVCPLAKVMRRELKKRGIDSLKVVYTKEEPHKTGSRVPASIAFMPSVMGLIIASEVIKELIND